MPAPSGRQFQLFSPTRGGQGAVVVEAGGGLRLYGVDGVDVLDGYAGGEMCAGGRGQPLLPWPNRLADGRYTWRGVDQQVPISEPSTSTAIHGLTRWAAWQLLEAGTDTVTVGHRLLPQPGYPWCLDAAITYRLDDDGLVVRTEVVNRSLEPAPFGLGFHPYLAVAAVGATTVDECVLTVPAATSYVADGRGLPIGSRSVDGTGDDYRAGAVVGDRHLDTAFTDLAREPDGRATLTLAGPGGRTVRLWADEAFGHLQVFSGDTLADPARRRRGLAVEPMTGPANLLATGDGLVVLDPDVPWTGTWGITPG